MSNFAGNHNNSGYGCDSTFFGFMIAALIMVTMLITTPLSSWLLTGVPASSGIFIAALIIGLVISLPTALAIIFTLNKGRPAAMTGAVALIFSYLGTMLLASAILGKFVMTANDIIYMGIPSVVVFVWVKYQENR